MRVPPSGPAASPAPPDGGAPAPPDGGASAPPNSAHAATPALGPAAPLDGVEATRAPEPPRLLAWAQRLGAVGLAVLLFTGTASPEPAASLGVARGAAVSVGAPLTPAADVHVAQAPGEARAATAEAAREAQPGAIVLGPKNAQLPGSDALARPAPALRGLEAQGFVVRPVRALALLNTLASNGADAPLSRQRLGAGGFDAVVNGGFYFDWKGKTYAAGPVVRRGVLEATGVPKSAHRGALAIRTDGAIVIGRQRGATLPALEARFGPLRALMGGGALLIEDGVKVASADLARPASAGGQQFDQGAGGLSAQQMRRTFHTVFAIRDGQLYLIGATDKTGAQIRDQLFAAGFDAAVKFDGGSGGYFREAGVTRSAGRAPLGFGVDLR